MAQCHCSAAQQNSQAHERFIEALMRFQQRFDVKGFDREDQRLVEFIDQWLADHIGRIDVQLRPYAANL
jgi:hemerythrin